VRSAFEHLGAPAAQIPALHVVGTNGKGSTAAMTAHALTKAGMRVGLYTSPHLVHVAERIRIGGEPIGEDALERAVRRVLAIELTFFEVLTLAAMLAFDEAGVQVIVLEAGLGGRLDATRIASTVAVAVTRIALDHQRYLGTDLRAIAGEKAAVMHHGALAFTSSQAPEVELVLAQAARAVGTTIAYVEPLARAPVGLSGSHQRENAALALALARTCVPTLESHDLDGVHWPGRLERVLHGGGEIVFDVAHNPNGIEAVVTSLRDHWDARDRVIVFGCMPDKDADTMVALLRRLETPIWIVPPNDSVTVALASSGLPGHPGRSFSSPSSPEFRGELAATLARGASVLVCGSHQLVGTVRVWADRGGDAVDPGDPLLR